MTKKLLLTLFILGFVGNVQAEVHQSQQCERDGILRTVDLVSAAGASVPCQVVYSKPLENQTTAILWNAQNDASYCQKKYFDFILKLESELKWSCSERHELSEETEEPKQSIQVGKNTEETNAVVLPENTILPEKPDDNQGSELIQGPIETQPISAPQNLEKTVVSARPKEPRQLAALPFNEKNDIQEQEISIELIRQFFPTGHYTASTQTPHTGKTSLCPSDGFYIWNTQRPDKPSFEMGTEAVFIFNLNQFSDHSFISISIGGGSRAPQCDYDIKSSYCINNLLQKQYSVSDAMATAMQCQHESTNSESAIRPLTLISSLVKPASQLCSQGAPSKYMGMASLPNSKTTNGNIEQGLEIVIFDEAGSEATCRYIKGR